MASHVAVKVATRTASLLLGFGAVVLTQTAVTAFQGLPEIPLGGKEGWYQGGNVCETSQMGGQEQCNCIIAIGGECSANFSNDEIVGCADDDDATCGDSDGNPYE